MYHYSPDRNYACRISTNYTYRGHDIGILENELIRVSLLLTKGTDIYEFLFKPMDVDFLFRTPMGVRHPAWLVTAPSNEANTWIDHYPGGWQEILPNGGYPSQLGGISLALHAEVSLQPWDYAIVDDEPEQVSLKTWVRTTRTPLYLEKTLTLKRSQPVLFISERLINESNQVIPIMWGHHIALGSPFLNETCRLESGAGIIIGEEKKTSPYCRLKAGERHAWPTYPDMNGNLIDISQIPSPSSGIDDMCYFGDFSSGWYLVTDPRRGLGFGVAWPKDVFSYVWYYQMFKSGAGYPWFGRVYSIGLEPFSSIPNHGLQTAIDNGTALYLQPGEEKKSWLSALVHTGGGRIGGISRLGEVVYI
jgi:hypothetical protein